MEMEDSKPNKGITVIDRNLHRRDDDDKAASTTQEEASKRRKVLNNGVVGEETVRSSAIDDVSAVGVDDSSPAKSTADDGACLSLETEESSSQSSSCYSNNESNDIKDGLRLVDLELKSHFESKITDLTSLNKSNKFRETTPSSELCVGLDEITELASPAKKKFPPKEEIEEFFAEAEKLDQKRFAEKYNYDIVNDLPLKGRYKWVSLKR